MAAKPDDIFFPPASSLLDAPPFVQEGDTDSPAVTCLVFLEQGKCAHGYKCRFLSGHLRQEPQSDVSELMQDEKTLKEKKGLSESNFITNEGLKSLRTKKVI